MKKVLLLLYNGWCLFWFLGIFLVLFPFMYVFIQLQMPSKGHQLFQLWANLFFPIAGMPIKRTYEYKPDPKNTYVFVANHFSYLDIAVGMGIIKNYFSFVGKSSVSKIPLLGYGFKKLHIAVDRSNKNSRSLTLKRGIEALAKGKSIFIMPEGGIISKEIPKMHRPFKDGPFLMAIANEAPIVPISFLNHHKIMPNMMIMGGRPHVVFHEPIATTGLTKEAIPELKEKVFQILQQSLDSYHQA